ncbi:hypothetical protein ABIS04_16430 [Shewanella sp. H8]|uniref:hypothetical protein n=1 Tax=Shewanella sp. H8 TaxID=3342676 RepID=UPI0033152377
MISLEQMKGIKQIEGLLPFLKFYDKGFCAWCLSDANDYRSAENVGLVMGERYVDVVRKHPEFAVQLSDILLGINLEEPNNLGYFIGFSRSIDKQIRG